MGRANRKQDTGEQSAPYLSIEDQFCSEAWYVLGSLLGFEDLDVVNPDGSRAEEVKVDANDVSPPAATHYISSAAPLEAP